MKTCLPVLIVFMKPEYNVDKFGMQKAKNLQVIIL
jgi:hypothetical protein